MRFRAAISFAACLAVFLTAGLGLNRGMVLSFDEHGHLMFESAHVLHEEAHADEGTDHDHDGFPADAQHLGLHASMSEQAQTSAGKVEHRADAAGVAAPLELVLHPAVSPMGSMRAGFAAWGIVEGHVWGSTARVQLACIGATVILV